MGEKKKVICRENIWLKYKIYKNTKFLSPHKMKRGEHTLPPKKTWKSRRHMKTYSIILSGTANQNDNNISLLMREINTISRVKIEFSLQKCKNRSTISPFGNTNPKYFLIQKH